MFVAHQIAVTQRIYNEIETSRGQLPLEFPILPLQHPGRGDQ